MKLRICVMTVSFNLCFLLLPIDIGFLMPAMFKTAYGVYVTVENRSEQSAGART